MKRLFLLFIICLANVSAMPLYISAADGARAGIAYDDVVLPDIMIGEDASFATDVVSSSDSVLLETDLQSIETKQTVAATESVEDEPIAAEPAVTKSAVDEIVTNESIADESAANEPVADEPIVDEPAADEQVAVETVVAEPIVVEPVVAESVSNSISIAGHVINIKDVDDTSADSGSWVNRYGNKFYYGHNSSAVFGGIVNYGIGDIFTITYGGVTTTYRVAETVVYEKNPENGLLQIDGEGDYMWYVSKARRGTKRYDISLMTCYGTSYGNGDASHRFVIFAKAL